MHGANISFSRTDAQLTEYIRTYWLQGATDATLTSLLKNYPQDATKGSPFDTGLLNQLSPQNKRISAFIGDAVFQAPRRYFLEQRVGKQNIWSYSTCSLFSLTPTLKTHSIADNKKLKGLPVLGATHGTDILDVYGETDLTSYFIQFAVSLDPNVGKAGLLDWPKYSLEKRDMLTIGDLGLGLGKDDYRKDAISFLTGVTLDHPL